MLSSAVLASIQGSAGFHAISEILLVWPPCMNWRRKFEFARHEIDLIALTSNSGGPSSISSGVCSFPILDRSHTSTRRSLPAVASTASLCGDHASWRISPLCARNSCSFLLGLRRSHRATSYACKQCVRSWCHKLLHSSFSSDLVSCSCR